MEEKNFNTIKAVHIGSGGKFKEKEYVWHLPKKLRGSIRVGDIVTVKTRQGFKKVYVTQTFREDIKVAGKKYKPVIKKEFSTLNVEKFLHNIMVNADRILLVQKNGLVDYKNIIGSLIGDSLADKIFKDALMLDVSIGGVREYKGGEQ